MKKIFCLVLAIVCALSVTAFAIDFTCLTTSISNESEGVYVKEGSISFIFSDNVDAETLSSFTIVEGMDAFTNFTTAIGDTNEVVLTFVSDLKYSTNYTINYAGLASTAGAPLKGTSRLSFTTEAEPEIVINSITRTKGIGSSVTILGEEDFLSADGSIQGFKVSISNKTSDVKTVNIVCALYNSNGIINRVLTAEKDITAASTDVVELGTKIGTAYANGSAKIYIWNNVSDKVPFVGSQAFDIQ